MGQGEKEKLLSFVCLKGKVPIRSGLYLLVYSFLISFVHTLCFE